MVQKQLSFASRQDCQSPYTVSKHVDSLKIWKRVQSDFPILKRLALKVLAVPDSNGFQERVFSFLRRIDIESRRCLSDDSLELDLILKANDKYLAERLSDADVVKAVRIKDKIKENQELADCVLNNKLLPSDKDFEEALSELHIESGTAQVKPPHKKHVTVIDQ